MTRAGGELRGERAAQPAARLLDPFDGAHIRLLVGHPHSPPRSIRKTKKTQKTTGPLPIGKRARIALRVVSELAHVRLVWHHRASPLGPLPQGSAHIRRQHGQQVVDGQVTISSVTLLTGAGRCQPAAREPFRWPTGRSWRGVHHSYSRSPARSYIYATTPWASGLSGSRR